MRTRLLLTGLTLILATGCASNGHHGEHEYEGDEKDEVKVAFADVPANVQAVLTREAKGTTIKSVDKETQHGKLVYEADVVVDGQNREIVVGADGTLVHNKIDAEEEDEKPGTGKKVEKEDDDEKEAKEAAPKK